MYSTLIEPEELAGPLARSAAEWAVIDCRFDLARPQWGAEAYAGGHIPGAVYAHLDRDLSGPVTPLSGRHPLPDPADLAATLGRWGIDESVQVVAYDQGNGAFAARLWWLLKWAGHQSVAVLNGGFAAWQQAGLPLESSSADEPPRQRQARQFTARQGATSALPGTTPVQLGTTQEPHGGAPRETQRRDSVVSTAELERMLASGAIANGSGVLVDARAPDRFAGENETIDPVAGHIPGARNHPFLRNVDAKGRFLPPSELRERWEATLAGPAGSVIAMCGSGVTACHNLLALEIAGLPGARLYAGSWSEWIRNPARPVARGPS